MEKTRKGASNRVRGFVAPPADPKWTVLKDATGAVCHISIELPCLPPSKNTYLRMHWASQQRYFFKPYEAWFGVHAPAGRPGIKGRVKVKIQLHFPDERNRDELNYAAFPPLMDCLQKLSVIENDSHKKCRPEVPAPIKDGTARTVIWISKEVEVDV